MESIINKLNQINKPNVQFKSLNEIPKNKTLLIKKIELEETKLGNKIVVFIRDYKMFLPDRYIELFDEETLNIINAGKEQLYLVYQGKIKLSGGRSFHKIEFTNKSDEKQLEPKTSDSEDEEDDE